MQGVYTKRTLWNANTLDLQHRSILHCIAVHVKCLLRNAFVAQPWHTQLWALTRYWIMEIVHVLMSLSPCVNVLYLRHIFDCFYLLSRKCVDFQTWGIYCKCIVNVCKHNTYMWMWCLSVCGRVCVHSCVRAGGHVCACTCCLLLTLFFSISLVSMTMTGAWCSHTICQKSSSVSGVGPGGGACRRGHSTPDYVHAALCSMYTPCVAM